MQIQEMELASEEQAWLLLEGLLGDAEIEKNAILVFKDWPVLEMHFEGRDFDASIPTRLMPAILDVQKELYRTYAFIAYGEANIRRLTDHEKAGLELVVKVGEGSTDLKAKAEEIFNRLVQGAITKMEARHYMVLLISAGLMYSANVMWKDWLNHQAEIKDQDTRIELSELETRRLKLIVDATQKNGPAMDFQESFNEARNRIFRSMRDTDKMSSGSFEVDGKVARELSHKPRQHSREMRIDGEFRVLAVDASDLDGFRIKVRREADGLEFYALIPDSHLTMKQEFTIQNAEWRKRPVKLVINARELRGNVTAATVMSAEEISEESEVGGGAVDGPEMPLPSI